uniref:Uncharacterized protein n=1 Tax=viral metagenome TaxID=1070528 RepID=A0A6C0DKP6_9ZZZZ
MLDAGKAKEERLDPHIRHFQAFENRAICKLINSKHYLGRNYTDTRYPDKYIKNKQICRRIDEIRYKEGLRDNIYARRHAARLNYKGFIPSYLNGGNASSTYGFADKLDLGGAGV